ncbi:hypothetical protein chiPu_0026636 [Chiloscyllium punctatum]|uniref:Uncharacterized protein n=1 Tax=Chiloscyllium punctatum TaxID=137246 RepID=A0A401TJ88_CHIPU|nr:hypothetical protein [Chiloscyllium punctatum]
MDRMGGTSPHCVFPMPISRLAGGARISLDRAAVKQTRAVGGPSSHLVLPLSIRRLVGVTAIHWTGIHIQHAHPIGGSSPHWILTPSIWTLHGGSTIDWTWHRPKGAQPGRALMSLANHAVHQGTERRDYGPLDGPRSKTCTQPVGAHLIGQSHCRSGDWKAGFPLCTVRTTINQKPCAWLGGWTLTQLDGRPVNRERRGGGTTFDWSAPPSIAGLGSAIGQSRFKLGCRRKGPAAVG